MTDICSDRNPANKGISCSLPRGHVSPHAMGDDGATWPTRRCGHFSLDFNGDCAACSREAEHREAMASAWDDGWTSCSGGYVGLNDNPHRMSS